MSTASRCLREDLKGDRRYDMCKSAYYCTGTTIYTIVQEQLYILSL